MGVTTRAEVLRGLADAMRGRFFELAAWEVFECAKPWREATNDVCEAIDFCEYYRRTAVAFDEIHGVDTAGRGVVAVIPPWNFPIAIPCGGVASALAAGNTVILKPASNTVMTAYVLAQCFWRAGVPR